MSSDWINILVGGSSAIVTWILVRLAVANWKEKKEMKKRIENDEKIKAEKYKKNQARKKKKTYKS